MLNGKSTIVLKDVPDGEDAAGINTNEQELPARHIPFMSSLSD